MKDTKYKEYVRKEREFLRRAIYEQSHLDDRLSAHLSMIHEYDSLITKIITTLWALGEIKPEDFEGLSIHGKTTKQTSHTFES